MKINILRLVQLLMMWFVSFSAHSENTVYEARIQTLLEDLRCPVCQNESLASSHAPLAHDLRKTIQTQIEQGKNDQQILDFLIARYGDFIYYHPPFKSTTFLLWMGPFVLLITGGVGLFFYLKRKGKM